MTTLDTALLYVPEVDAEVTTDRRELEATAGLSVTVERSMAATIDRLRSDSFDCLVSGLELPDGDGLELFQRVRSFVPSLPFVLYTARGSERVASEAIGAGVTDYVVRDDQHASDSGRPTHDEPSSRTLPERITAICDTTESDVKLRTFRRAVEQSGHSIYWTDAKGTIEYVNPKFEETTGYSAAEALGRSPTLLQSGEHDSEFYTDLWETILAGDVWRNEVVNRRKNGERYVVEQTIAPVTTPDGEIERFVAANVDVTERRRRERELRRKNERLESFAGVLSHDVRNPLNVARGRTALARETNDCAHLNAVVSAHERIETLVDDLLSFARVGPSTDDTDAVDVADVASAAWESVPSAEATFRLSCRMTVDAHAGRLRELFENLLGNAVQHAGPSPVVRVGGLDEPGFFVEDDGPGIPPDARDQLFEFGYTTTSDGTGFGLAIVEEIAAAHEWAVGVTSSSEGGARFEFHTEPVV